MGNMKKNKDFLGFKENDTESEDITLYWRKMESKYDFISMVILMLVVPAVFLFIIRKAEIEINGLLIYLISDVFFLIVYFIDRAKRQRERERDRTYFEENRELLKRKIEELGEWEEAQKNEEQKGRGSA